MSQFVIPYIMFKDTKEAVSYYINVFGGHVRYQMLGKDMPNCPEGQEERIMHLEYVFHETVLYMADDDLPDHGRIHLHLDFESKEDMIDAFNKMKIEGTVLQELQSRFWGATLGVIQDKYAVTWQFHHSEPKE